MAETSGVLHNAVTAVITFAGLDAPKPQRSEPELYVYGMDAGVDTPTYHLWLRMHAKRRKDERDRALAALGAHPAPPTISVLVPVFRPDRWMLEACVASVVRQSYPHWELLLCDDASDDDGTTAEMVRELATTDPRIRSLVRNSNGGISEATNDAASAATGAFLALLDQDDELEDDVLTHVAHAIIQDPSADVLYTDQDKLDVDGVRSEPYFKPGWSPDLLLSNMYLGHLLVVRSNLFHQLGGLRKEFDGSQDYDLALRSTEVANHIRHVPVIGYHWRRIPGSTALDYSAKPAADLAARRALQEAMDRRGQAAIIEDGLLESTFRVRRRIIDHPLVSIIVPFHDGARLLRKCVDSLHETAGYDHWEALLVDNRSWEPETTALVQRLGADEKVRLLGYDEPFNWSAINNWASERARGSLLLFLNSDIEGLRPGWLEAMVEHAQRPEVGAVGARLVYPDRRVQHAGVVLGLGGGVAWHAFCFCPPENNGYFGHARMIRNYSGVTGACMMVRRSTFDEVGRFDEDMAVAFNDVDFCIRLQDRGFLVVYTPFAELIHYEGATRGRGALEDEESREMFRRWGRYIHEDQYFNRNLDPHRSEFCLSIGTEEVDSWE